MAKISKHPSDIDLEKRIEDLKTIIRHWADRHNLWDDSAFTSWSEYFDDEPPESPCVLLLYHEGNSLYQVMNDYKPNDLRYELEDLVNQAGFGFMLETSTHTSFWVKDKDLKEAYRDYYEWRWILELIKPDYDSLYEEIFERFKRKPDDLHKLEPRQFEQLLDAIFRNNGYRTELGPGQGDGGVDLRLYTNDVVSESLTLVQAKRYAKNRPIGLEAVQALSGAVTQERANRGLFITTPRYLPGVHDFASRQDRLLILKDANYVQELAASAANLIIRDKSSLVSKSHVQRLLEENLTTGLEGKIFHTVRGIGITINVFAIVLKESKGAALLMKLPMKLVSGEWQVGTQIPDVGISALTNLNEDNVFRARKIYNQDRLMLWGDLHSYTLWDGTPQYFNLLD